MSMDSPNDETMFGTEFPEQREGRVTYDATLRAFDMATKRIAHSVFLKLGEHFVSDGKTLTFRRPNRFVASKKRE